MGDLGSWNDVPVFRCVRSRPVGPRGRWRPVLGTRGCVAGSASVVVSQSRRGWLVRACEAPQTRAIHQILRRQERLRELTTHFVAFMRRHPSNPPPGAKFGNFPPPLGGKLPSFGSTRPAGPFYANSAAARPNNPRRTPARTPEIREPTKPG